MAKRFFTWILVFIGLSLVLSSFRGEQEQVKDTSDDFTLEMSQTSYNVGDTVLLNVLNNLDQSIRVDSGCPAQPLRVERYTNGVWQSVQADQGVLVSCSVDALVPGENSEFSFQQPQQFLFAPSEMVEINYDPWKKELFSDLGRYRLSLDVTIDTIEKSFSTEFEITELGFFWGTMYNLFFRPIFNLLLYLTSILPGYSFGLAVVVLTVMIRLVLLVPNQKALKSQRSMLKIQPEIEAIKKKYKGDQERISKETMALWKKHKVNPVGGCLPLLIQLPILIALFYVVKTGFSPYQGHIIYDFLTGVDLSQVSTNFFASSIFIMIC